MTAGQYLWQGMSVNQAGIGDLQSAVCKSRQEAEQQPLAFAE
jgi:hypothetical protein